MAARDHDRATAFATKHGIPRVLGTYEELVSDPEIDAVYNPLPNGLHGRWTLAALAAGKHVLCEKPFTANAAEARAVSAAIPAGVVVMEAFHYRYHPVFMRARAIARRRRRRRGAAHRDVALFSLADVQGHPVPARPGRRGRHGRRLLRHSHGPTPRRLRARGRLGPRHAASRRAWTAPCRRSFASRAVPTGQITCSMWSRRLLHVGFHVTGDAGELRVFNPVGPNIYSRLSVRGPGGRQVEHLSRRPTYEFQLEAFCAAVDGGDPPSPTSPTPSPTWK